MMNTKNEITGGRTLDAQIRNEVKLKYLLTFGNKISDPTKNQPELQLVEGVGVPVKDHNNATYNLIFNGIRINKKIYQPCEIEAEFDFTMITVDDDGKQRTTAPSFDDVINLLLQRQVKVEVLELPAGDTIDHARSLNQAITIAENCYVFEVNPQLKRDVRGTKMYVKVNIFSMDKLMTLNKYSKAYVARKLGSGILKPESMTFCKNDAQGNPLIKTNIEGMRFLKYDEQFVVEGNDGKKILTSIPSEFIQPYLVQYNESFYDFLVRTSNRCGEFLFFENGELTLGLPDSGDPLLIDDFDSVTLQSITEAPLDIPDYARDSAKEGNGSEKDLNFTPIEKRSDGYPGEVFPKSTSYNSEIATDEYIFPLYKDKATSLLRESMLDGGHRAAIFSVMETLKNYAKSTKSGGKAILDTAIKTGAVGAVQSIFIYKKSLKINEKLEDEFFSPMKGNSEQYNGDTVVQFGTLSENGWTTLNYYSDVRQHEEKQQKKIICIDMSTKFYPLRLGQKIKIVGTDDTYVVIQLLISSEEGWKRDYTTYDNRHSDRSESQRSMKVYAIPAYTKDNKSKELCFIPPVQPIPITRKSGPQTAFIVASNDPKYQGRVRIAYPWQSLGSQIQERFDVAESALKEAQANKELAKKRKEQLEDEYKRLVTEKEDLESWANMSREEREVKRAELKEAIRNLEQSIHSREDAIDKAIQDVHKKEVEIDNLPADTEDREGRLMELEDDKQVLVLAKNNTINKNNPKIAEEKEELARKKAHLAELTEVENKSKRDAVLRNKQEELMTAATNLKAAESKEEAYKKEVKEKEKEKNKAESEKKEKMESIASPWIRVATPVATEGGGFFYEPRQGDEVLVNFDNDNVERPYVVGQLYSKNTLDPRERMNRKKSMKGLGTMALVSPNGHHIAFQDPEDGAKFLNSTVPVIGAFNKAATLGIGIPTISEFHPKKAKDLTGGIHIGDRYGLYEISMSSDGRKINISSPLGQVNLSAFTGISIDAPNGDIKIRGKNVNISAGNKVTIESGTNIGLGGGIGGPGYKYTNDDHWYNVSKGLWTTSAHMLGHEVLLALTPEAGKLAYSEAIPLTNVELLRYLTQVFLRPIDGTMLIKSHKYMLLEAGQGKAMVKGDRYKKKKADDYFKVYESMIACVEYIQNGLKAFYETYDDLWKKAFEAHINWISNVANVYFESGQAPDIPNTVFSYCIEDDSQKWDDMIVTSLVRIADLDKKYKSLDQLNNVKRIAAAYGEALYNLRKFVLKAQHPIFLITQLTEVPASPEIEGHKPLPWVLDILLSILEETKLFDDWQKMYEVNGKVSGEFLKLRHPKDSFSENRTEFKRRVAALFLLHFNRSEENKKNKYIHIVFNEYHFCKDSKWIKLKGSMWGAEKLSKDYYWRRFVKNMDRYIQNSNFFRSLVGSFYDTFFANKFKKELWTSTEIWDKDQGGQILMSDNRDYTLNLVKDGVRSEDAANQFNYNRLTQILYDVK